MASFEVVMTKQPLAMVKHQGKILFQVLDQVAIYHLDDWLMTKRNQRTCTLEFQIEDKAQKDRLIKSIRTIFIHSFPLLQNARYQLLLGLDLTPVTVASNSMPFLSRVFYLERVVPTSGTCFQSVVSSIQCSLQKFTNGCPKIICVIQFQFYTANCNRIKCIYQETYHSQCSNRNMNV